MTQTVNSSTGSRLRISLACAVTVVFGLFALAPAGEAKIVVDGFAPAGPSPNGTHGGQLTRALSSGSFIPVSKGLTAPTAIAVNTSGNGASAGTLYVADGWGNRVQRFSSTGAFQRAWGENVLGRDEFQTIAFQGSVDTTSGGFFTLSLGGVPTEPIKLNGFGNGTLSQPEPAKIQKALTALPSVGAGGVSVISNFGKNTFLVRFTKGTSGTDVQQLTADGTGLTGPPLTISVATLEQGSGGDFTGFEICTVAAECQNAEASSTAANGGQLSNPGALAVDQSNGDVYVAENSRISKFDADGNFLRAFGWDVVSPGNPGDVPGVNEQQTVTLGAKTTGGKFALSYESETTGVEGSGRATKDSKVVTGVEVTKGGPFAVGQSVIGESIPAGTTITAVDTVGAEQTLTLSKAVAGSFPPPFSFPISLRVHDIPWDASPAQVQASLESLPGIAPGDVSVSSANPGGGVIGGPYTVTFQGALSDVDVSQLGSSASGLTVSSGTPSVSIATAVTGRGNFEICTVAADCKQGASGDNGGQMSGSGAIAFDASGDVWVADSGNLRIQEFASDGNFIAVYGWDVDAPGGAGGLEKCTSTAAGACREGSFGTAPGQFGTGIFSFSPTSIGFDSSGDLFAVDPGNHRVQRFNPAMSAVTDFAAGTFSDESSSEVVVPVADGERLAFAVESNGEDQILELDPDDGSVEGTNLAGAGLTNIEALGYDPAGAGTIYATTKSQAYGALGVLILGEGPVPPPLAALDPIAVFDDTSATFTGSIDPDGFALGDCKFQYSTDQANWVDVPLPDCSAFARDGGPQAVSEEVEGLEPGTHYYVRLSANRPYNPAAVGLSTEQEFTTPSKPPLLSEVGAVRIEDTSAYLVAAIRPRSQTSHYRFQYTTTNFDDCGLPANPGCLQTPETELTGSGLKLVAQPLGGLTPDTEYDFKLTVDNEAGTVESGVFTFQTRAEPLPNPDERGYEQVSPAAGKNFNDIGTQGDMALAEDGEGASFPSITSFDDADGQTWAIFTSYVARRSADGWHTLAPNPPVCGHNPVATEGGSSGGLRLTLSADLRHSVVSRTEFPDCPIPPLDPAAPLQSNLYLSELDADPPTFTLLTPQPAIGTVDPGLSGSGGKFAGANPDFSNVVYASTNQMTADSPAGSFDKLFAWQGGSLSLLSKDTTGAALTTASALAGDDSFNSVSENGQRVFFHNPTSGASQELYMRQGGTATFDVSQSECTSSCGSTAADVFWAATPNGAKALFTSTAKLTNSDTSATGADLYLYTHSAKPDVNANLTLLSKDEEPADGTKAEVQGVLGMSDDGGTVFFAANGQVVAGAPADAGPKLYRWRANGGSPTIEYLAALAPDDFNTSTLEDTDNWSGEIRRVTGDGSTLLIQTRAPLDLAGDPDAAVDVYRWRQVGGWACVSCQLPSASSTGDSSISDAALGKQAEIGGGIGNAMSADGQRVFFSSRDGLVAADTNGKSDVYEWHDGALTLISSGLGAEDVEFAGVSLSGRDVFFLTRERLVGWDTDTNTDLYDARIGGGFPEPPPAGAPCEVNVGACESAGTSPPPATGAGSAVFEGPGNVPSAAKKGGRRCPKGRRMVRRKGKARCVKAHAKQGKRAANRNRRAHR